MKVSSTETFFVPAKHQLVFALSYLFSVHLLSLNGTQCCTVTSSNWTDLYGVIVDSLGVRSVASVSSLG